MKCAETFCELDKSHHDRASFDCGEPELNRFLQTQAAKHMANNLSVTRILPAADPIQHLLQK